MAAAELKVASFTSALGNACRAPHSQPHHATVLDTVDVPAPDRCQSYTCDKPFLGCFAVHHSPAFMAHQRSLCGIPSSFPIRLELLPCSFPKTHY